MESTTVLFTGSALVLLGIALRRLLRLRQDCLFQSKVIAATSCGVVVTDATEPRHPVIYVNPAFRLLTGYADVDILGQSTAILAGSETDRASVEKLSLALQDGRACRVRLLHYRKNGTSFWNEITLSPVKDRAGRVTSVIWVMSDVTQRREAEAIQTDTPDSSRHHAAGRTDADPESDLAIARLGSWERDARTGIEIWSDEQCRIFGYEPGAILPTYDTFKGALHPEDRERVLAAGERLLASDEPYDEECRIVQPSGTIRFIRVRGLVIRNFAGEPVRLSGTVQDTTSDVLFEEAAKERDHAFRLVVESAPHGLLMVGQDGGISMANSQIEQIFGYSRDELAGKPMEALLSEPDRPTLHIAQTELWSDPTARSRGVRKELCGLRKDGSEFPIEIGLNQASMASGTSVLATVIDITDRKKAEAYLRVLSKMEAIGTLSGGIAHEFNSSLTAVLGFSHLALPLIPAGSKAHRYIQQVTSAGRECRDLVHQLLAFSRQGDQVRRPLSLHLLVKELLKLLRPTIPSWIDLKVQIDASASPVLADPTQMHQMIINLVDKALHAMRKTVGILEVQLQGKEILADQITPSGRLAAGSYVCLTVRNSGEGTESKVVGRVDDPFVTIKPLGDGQGMGLSVIQEIVAIHGGTVVAENQIGVGTAVSVYFPALPPRATSVPTTDEPLPRGYDECILFVDDEESLARCGGEMLVSLGYYPVIRTSATAAWEAFQLAPQRFALLIADQTMPDMTGDRLADRCRQIRPDLPVILCADSEQTLSEDEARMQGIAEFAPKPLTLNDLAHRIRRVLDARPTACPSSPEQLIQVQEQVLLSLEGSDAVSSRR
jgi:PAS domain S-box-containing protein